MFNLEWREAGFLAVVSVFWLVVLRRIYVGWDERRRLQRLHVTDAPRP